MAKYISEVGSYRCMVMDPPNGQWFGESEEKKTPYIAIRAVVNDPDSDQHGAEITYYAWLSDGAFDRTIKGLSELFGWNGDMEALAAGEVTFTGQECTIVTESEEYDGKKRIRAKWLNSVDRQGPVMAQEKVKSLIARLGSKAKAIAKATGAASAPAQKPQPKVDAPF